MNRPRTDSTAKAIAGQRELASNRLLLGNSIWNLLGDSLPLIVAVFAVPLTIRGLGTAGFGVLMIAWIVTGYLSLLDFGLGKALTKYVAETIGKNRTDEVPRLFWTALHVCVLLGIVSAMVFAWACPWAIHNALKVPRALQPQTETAFYLIALCLPLLICGACLRGFLAALQRFDLLNTIKIPLSVFSFAAPVLVLPFSLNIAVILGVLLGGRCLAVLLELFLCFKVERGLSEVLWPDLRYMRPLFSFGVWITVSMVLGPMLVYSDRFLIGALLSMTDVTHYNAPMEMIARLAILPSAIAQVIFPALSYTLAKDPRRAAVLFERANKYMLGFMFPVILLAVTFAPELLRLWLGKAFADASAEVTQLLSISALFTGLTYVPASLIQAAGRPDIFATVILVEAPVYLPLMWGMIRLFGINGAAIACIIRGAVNVIVCFTLARRMLPAPIEGLRRTELPAVAAALVLVLAVTLNGNPFHRAVMAFGILSGFGWSVWRFLLSVEERRFIMAQISAARAVIYF